MAKWAFMTTIFYILLVILFLIPSAWWLADIIAGENDPFSDIFELLSYWLWWIVIGVIVLIQAMLLLYPVGKTKERPKPQRALWISIIVAGVLFSLLLLGVFASVAAAIWGDNQDGFSAVIFWVVFISLSWFVWAFIFYRFAKATDADSFMARTLKWLVTGSILELLVAVPCHVIVRHKDVCCAQGLTFYGIAAGLVVMALAFGPGIFFLFLKRIKSLRPNYESNNEQKNMVRPLYIDRLTVVVLILGITLLACTLYIIPISQVFNKDLKTLASIQKELEKKVANLEARTVPPIRTEEFVSGKPFPDLQFKAVDGNDINIKNLRGKYVLIDFWATWCGPCKSEIPGLVELYNQYHNKGFEIIGISLDSDIMVLKEFLASSRVTWPQYFDGKGWSNEVSSRFGIHSIPSTVLIDKDGIVLRRCLRGKELKIAIEKLFNSDSKEFLEQ
jgi:thiol-disulfide isomerase/thioredoxin